MEKDQGTGTRSLFGILILLVALQAGAIGLALYYGSRSSATDKVLLERTGLMTEEMFPGIRQDLAEVSQKAAEIKGELAGVGTAVGRVEERMGSLDRGIGAVGQVVGNINNSLTGFVQDRTVLIWGHSLNPYLLLAALGLIAISIPLSGVLFSKVRKRQESPLGNAMPEGMEVFSKRLEDISELLERIRKEEGKEPRADAEIRRLMLETERVIADARAELAIGPHGPEWETEPTDRAKRTLH
ncbi:MAG: hypothetical protein HY913_04115 [Desulfomonile tiedjei]|nr:hypothetical protein [Desulfomonile tiedjei]